jgi:uncharacterized membrane protein YqjE
MNFTKHRTFASVVKVVSAPLLLAVVELFHPHPHDLLNLDLPIWLSVHFAQLLLFPLAALSVTVLVRHHTDFAAMVCRIAMFVFAVSFTAFDTAAGIVTGVLVKLARQSGTPEAWRQPIEALWQYPFMGGGSWLERFPSLAVIASVSLPIGAVAAAVSLKRAGRGWAPVLLLAIAGFGITIFDGHSWPGGPLTFGGIALAGGWLQWQAAQMIATAKPLPVRAHVGERLRGL